MSGCKQKLGRHASDSVCDISDIILVPLTNQVSNYKNAAKYPAMGAGYFNYR